MDADDIALFLQWDWVMVVQVKKKRNHLIFCNKNE